MKKSLLGALLLQCAVAMGQETAAPLWLRYPAISPNGKEIIFNYKGSLFKVSADGGVAVPLTLNNSYNYKAVWSPDGKQVAFASDRNGNFDVYVMPSQGGTAQRLTTFSGGELPTSFTPDGKKVLYNAVIADSPENVMFPSGVLPELYAVSVAGGRPEQVLTVPAQEAVYDKAAKRLLYYNRKGYENEWRKHHTSAVARDVMMYDVATQKHEYITSFMGEDRNPVFAADEKSIYYLSEQSGTFNVHQLDLGTKQNTQITRYDKHPVRFLTASQDNKLCYSFDGEIYVKEANGEPRKINVTLPYEFANSDKELLTSGNGATEISVSPDGKEVVFVERGEVFVTAVEYGTTKRITNTPEQERNVSFSPDGKSILYAGERNGSWNLYQTKLVKADEKHFYNATEIKEEPLLETEAETFQPMYSPDGKEVAFLEERVILRVINLATKQVRTILGKEHNYSYSDGDQWYNWSPDSKWFLVNYATTHLFLPEVGLISADGKGKVKNLTNSGYSDTNPIWQLGGKAMLWSSDRQGMRSHGSWGAQDDMYALFFTQDAYNQFVMSKEEYEAWKETNKKDDKKEDKKDDKKKDDKKGKSDDKKEESVKPIEIDFEHLEDRRVRLTIHSSQLGGAFLNKDGTKLYYMSRFEKGFDLWVNDFKEHETKLLAKLDAGSVGMEMSKDGESLFVVADGSLSKISLSDGKKKGISYRSEMNLDRSGERAYFFEHAWRQVKKKFYDPALHGVDWDFYKKAYNKFLPHINNNYDFAEMLSELLGELNASHTGSGYRHSSKQADQTASLAAFYDTKYKGNGLKIVEIMDKSPLQQTKKAVKVGDVIEKIDGVLITPDMDYYPLLNRKAGKPVTLTIAEAGGATRRDETIKPVSVGRENELLYERWVKRRREQVEKLSGGRLGYVHVQGMNSQSFREVYSEVLGRYSDKEAIVIDTRFNGGGWLHDDLATLFTGKEYVTLSPRGQDFGHDPMSKWTKPSALLVSESNYSDAHAFPYVYQTLGIGKIVGMPVPGTMTAVWWETLQDPTLYFGIPEVGAKDTKGKYLENQQLEPDVKVNNEYEQVVKGRDQQLEKAVETLLNQLGKK